MVRSRKEMTTAASELLHGEIPEIPQGQKRVGYSPIIDKA